MEATRAEKFRLGIFILLVVSIFSVFVIYVAGRRLLEKNISYYTYFEESVDGLNPGAKVKLNGVIIGQVDQVRVSPDDVRYVYVHYQLQSTAPIKQGMQANLVGGISITGLKSIEISGGHDSLPPLAPGSEIPAGTSQIQKITGQAESIALKFEGVMNNLLELSGKRNSNKLSSFLNHLESLSNLLDQSLSSQKKSLKQLPPALVASINDFRKTSTEIRKLADEITQGHPAKKINATLKNLEGASSEMHKQMKELQVNEALKAFTKAAGELEAASRRIDLTLMRINEDLGSGMSYLRETMENMADFSRQIREDPSILLRRNEKEERRK